MNGEKKVLMGLSPEELKAVVRELGMPSFTASQILKWLYQQHVGSIDEMTNLSKANRERLTADYVVGAMAPIALCFVPGGLQDELPVLPDGQAGL